MDHSPVTFLQVTLGIDRNHPDVGTAIVAAVSVGHAPPEAADPSFMAELEACLAVLAGSLPARLSAQWAVRN